MSNQPHTQKLGDILLKGKLINDEQLAIALREHQITGGKFGSIITSLKYTTEKSIIFFLYRKIFVKKKNRDINFKLEKMLGELLVSYRIITLKDLAEVLEFQKDKNIKLGYALSEMDIIDEKSLLDALKRQIFNSEENFTGKGNADEEIEDLTNPKKPIPVYIPIFAGLLLVIIILPTWYYFSNTNTNDTPDTKKTLIISKKPKKQTVQEEITKIENELRFVLSLHDEKNGEPTEAPSTSNDNNAEPQQIVEDQPTPSEEPEELIVATADKPKLPTKVKRINNQAKNNIKNEIAKPKKVTTSITNKDDDIKVSSTQVSEENNSNRHIIQAENIRYFSDGKIAKFVFDSKENLKHSFVRTYLNNQNMKFEFSNSSFKAVAIKNGHSDKLIENFSIKKTNNGFVMRYRMKHPGSSLYHVLPPTKQNPLYRLAIVVRPTK